MTARTVSDARSAWCPFAMVGCEAAGGMPSLSPAFNRYMHDGKIGTVGHCIGPLCMAWSWLDPAAEVVFRSPDGKQYGPGEVVPTAEQAKVERVEISLGDRRRGFCGLTRDLGRA